MTNVMLVGNPNCGKSTIFNSLTGSTQSVGNWSGVTVEKKTGTCSIGEQIINVTDLPGVYSLDTSYESAQDALITIRELNSSSLHDSSITTDNVQNNSFNLPHQLSEKFILKDREERTDLIVNVIDACHLERHLYLTSQLLELGKPMIIVLNMSDIAKHRGISIDTQALSLQLRCPVIVAEAHRKIGILELQKAIQNINVQEKPISLHIVIENVSSNDETDKDILLADARYNAIHKLVISIQTKHSDANNHKTAMLDRIVLHRFFAIPIFFGMMYLLFFLAINVGGAFQDFFNITTDAIFVQGMASVLRAINSPDWLVALCAYGIGKGINTTMTFVPVIAVMFFLLSLLETSGYMTRAAFVIDRAMRWLGLPGKSFVPMIVSFGCNVPAIMAARSLDCERDRVLTVLMSPFMSCSARLTIYAVFVAAFFPTNGQNIVFSLYVIGIIMAVLTGLLLRKTVLHGTASPLILELPAYHRPSLQRLFKDMSRRLRYFLIRAGKLIIPICVILGGLNALMLGSVDGQPVSVLAVIGQWLTPLFSPMGIQQDNWPAVVGLLTGTLAKEVVVGSLNSLYSQIGHLSQVATVSFDLLSSIKDALWSILHNLSQLVGIDWVANGSNVSSTVYGVMYNCFSGKSAAYSYLLFILLYIPCVSTMAAIRQETNSKFMWFSIGWSLLVAYTIAVLFYQIATCMEHIQQTITWVILLVSIVCVAVAGLLYRGRNAIATA